MSMASGMFISVVSLLYPICKSFLPQISQILTDIAMGIIIRVRLCYPWDMILTQIPQMLADVAMG